MTDREFHFFMAGCLVGALLMVACLTYTGAIK